jgi:hypothetical protein
MESEHDRAALWSAYFALRAVTDPPDFVARALDDLKRHLDGGHQPAAPRLRLADHGDRPQRLPEVDDFKFRHETGLRRIVSSRQAVNAIEHFLGDPVQEVLTLEELPRHTRGDIASIRGVGARTMIELDAALEERDMRWADDHRPVLAAAKAS